MEGHASPHLSYGLRYEVNSRIHEQTLRTSLPEFLDANGKPTSYSNHQANMDFVVNPQPPYDKDWNGWGPRVALDYALSDHTVLHAGGAITTRLHESVAGELFDCLNPLRVQSLLHGAAGHCGSVPEPSCSPATADGIRYCR